jgi:PAS domain-containing protein
MKTFLPGNDLFEIVLDAIPAPILVVDQDVAIHAYNRAAAPLFDHEPEAGIRMGCGDALHCIHSTETPEGCGGGEACRRCVIRNSVQMSYKGKTVVRSKSEMQRVGEGTIEKVHMLVTTAPFRYNGESLALVILEDISELVALKRILPICAKCKKVRDDEDFWHDVEDYLARHSTVEFTHGLCPECLKILYGDFMDT